MSDRPRVIYHYANGEKQECGLHFGLLSEAEAHAESVNENIRHHGILDIAKAEAFGLPDPPPYTPPWHARIRCRLWGHQPGHPCMTQNTVSGEFYRIAWCKRCGRELQV